jgi:hypothetical protein
LYYLGLNFQIFLVFSQIDLDSKTLYKVVSFYSVNEYKIHFLAQVPVSAEVVLGEISKSAEVTEPGRAAQAFFTFE